MVILQSSESKLPKSVDHRRHEGNLFGAEIPTHFTKLKYSWELQIPSQGTFESMIFPFPRVGYESFLRAGILKYGESVDFYWYAHSLKLT